MGIIVKNMSYSHSDNTLLFENLSISIVSGQKVNLIGKNGSGKSTLLKLIAGKLKPISGEINISSKPYYIPQHFGQFDQLTVSETLGIAPKLKAMQAILKGEATIQNLELLNDDWSIEENAYKALSTWNLTSISLDDKMENLSGGEKTAVLLAGIVLHQPEIILLDEPSNHLDSEKRIQLCELIRLYKGTLILVSHDRDLLNINETTLEITNNGIETYGGNYETYKTLKEQKVEALKNKIADKEKDLRLAKQQSQQQKERNQRLKNRDKKKQAKGGIPKIVMNALKNKSENSSSKQQQVHLEKIEGVVDELRKIRMKMERENKFVIRFLDSSIHQGKRLVIAEEINYSYNEKPLWENTLSFQIRSGDRIAIQGANGSGKTTLIKLILSELKPKQGNIIKADFKFIYLDQNYTLIDKTKTVYEQIQLYNSQSLSEHELKMYLHQFLLPVIIWDNKCETLSGGENIKLIICCLFVSNQAPDLIVLDEPTNNLDIPSLEILSGALQNYKGTLLVISHDSYFIKELNIEQFICL